MASRLRPSAWAAPAGANDAVRVGVIGLGNKGLNHLITFAKIEGIRVTAICDVDPERVARALATTTKGQQPAPFATSDAREVLERNDVDAVFVATCNHWHALIAVWACQAGKDVYVEKPMTHTVWEGRKMIEAAAKYRRVVQVGTQYRSGTALPEATQYVREGQLGKLKYLHAPAYIQRPPIGRRFPWYPQGVNYDLFCGPAAMAPLERDQLHFDWHWMWSTGNGTIGDNGVHFLDLALYLGGHKGPPGRILSLGGLFNDPTNDAAETPNTQLVVYDYPAVPIIFETRSLPAQPGVKFMDQTAGIRYGIVAHCEGGYLSGLSGFAAHDADGKVIRKFAAEGSGPGHVRNFLAAVRNRRPQDLVAPVEIGHASASVCHYGNISLRSGKPASPSQIASKLEAIPAAAELGRGLQKHLGAHGFDLERQPLTLGPWLELDVSRDGISALEPGAEARLDYARYLLRETHRPPYAIPEKV